MARELLRAAVFLQQKRRVFSALSAVLRVLCVDRLPMVDALQPDSVLASPVFHGKRFVEKRHAGHA